MVENRWQKVVRLSSNDHRPRRFFSYKSAFSSFSQYFTLTKSINREWKWLFVLFVPLIHHHFVGICGSMNVVGSFFFFQFSITFHEIVERVGTFLYKAPAISRFGRGRQCCGGGDGWHCCSSCIWHIIIGLCLDIGQCLLLGWMCLFGFIYFLYVNQVTIRVFVFVNS